MMKNAVGLMAILALGAGCAARPTLAPAPTAQAAPGRPGGAIDVVAGVSFSAWPERWSGTPTNLDEHVTPVLVRIENESESDVLVRFEHFRLANPAGGDYAAIPPFDLDAVVEEPIAVRFPLNGFRIAPHLRPYYPGLSPYTWPYDLDGAYWSRYTTAWREIELPTADMVQMALPEGALEPGGVITGYLYFERVSGDAGRVDLEYRVMTAERKQLGVASIPFVVRS